MTKKPFTVIAAGLLSVVAVVQLLRLVRGWEVTIDGVSIPMWASGVAVVIAAGLAAMVWIETRR
jgi:hypothetical protein